MRVENLIREEDRLRLLDNDKRQRPVRGTRQEIDLVPVVLLAFPFSDCVWMLTEMDTENTEIAFGLADLGVGFPELGGIYLPELEELKLGPVRVVQDTSFVTTRTLNWWTREAQSRQSLAAAIREHRALTRRG